MGKKTEGGSKEIAAGVSIQMQTQLIAHCATLRSGYEQKFQSRTMSTYVFQQYRQKNREACNFYVQFYFGR